MPEIYENTLPHVNVGTLGHMYHGKSTLTAAIKNSLAKKHGGTELSVADIAVSPEMAGKRNRKASWYEYITEKRHYAHVDCPGQEIFSRRTYSSAAIMDAAILVVSARDGIQAQTGQHVVMAKQSNVPHLAVFINMFDAETDEKELNKLERKLKALLTKSGFQADQCPIIKGSALKALEGDEGSVVEISKLADFFDGIPEPQRELEKPFFMPISNVVYVKDLGFVAGGKVEEGSIKDGEEMDLVGFGKSETVICKSVAAFKKKMPDGAKAGDTVTILLTKEGAEWKSNKSVRRGMVLCKPGTRSVHSKVTVKVDILTKREGGRSGGFGGKYKPAFYCYSWNCAVSLTELPEGVLKVHPGDKDMSLTITLNKPMAVDVGSQICIRDDNATVATGVVTDILE